MVSAVQAPRLSVITINNQSAISNQQSAISNQILNPKSEMEGAGQLLS
jgi:hypothetical protein